MTLYKWLQASGSNANVDATVNWAEGQAPSTVNDSARGMMAATAKYRDDIAGAIVTGGTPTAYTVSSYEVFDTLAHLGGQMIAFTPHATNAAGSPSVALNVDGLGAKPLRSAPNVELAAGVLIQGTPYVATYNNSDSAFYLHGFFGNPYNLPVGGSIDYWGTSAPNSSFAFMYGQAISRTTYAALFALFSTTFGTGDGSTTFNIPDLRGRLTAGKDDMGGSAANSLTNAASGITGTTLGASGGAQTVTLFASAIPAGVPSSGSISGTAADSGGKHIASDTAPTQEFDASISGGGTVRIPASNPTNSGAWSDASLTLSGTASVTSTNSGQTAVNKMPPTIICNKLIRII